MNVRPLATILLTVALLGAVPPVAAVPPPTVYEEEAMSPQNMDFDAENNMFRAHAGWIDDRLIHYYKFRIYAPDTYPTKVQMGEPPRIPIAPAYLPTSDGTLQGSANYDPVLRYHTADGENYSDFVELFLVKIDAAEQPPRSWAEVEALNRTFIPTGILVNMPLVPTGSTLEDPTTGRSAPIKPLMAWYGGDLVQTFVFETSSQDLADAWNPITRDGLAARAGSGYEMTVARLRVNESVPSIPIWHVNQYFEGVTPGVNSGGPSEMGMRNVIDLDRAEPGYSPLWQIHWVSRLPPSYRPDHASSADVFTEANGFTVMPLPMFVNCPNIGPVGGSAPNAAKASAFVTIPRVGDTGRVTLQGALVMEADKLIEAKVGDLIVTNTTTNMMGGYALHLNASDLADGENTVQAIGDNGTVHAEWLVLKGDAAPTPSTPTPTTTTPTAASPTPTPADDKATPFPVALVVLAGIVAAISHRRRGRE